jgi:hypothetical protein
MVLQLLLQECDATVDGDMRIKKQVSVDKCFVKTEWLSFLFTKFRKSSLAWPVVTMTGKPLEQRSNVFETSWSLLDTQHYFFYDIPWVIPRVIRHKALQKDVSTDYRTYNLPI